MFNRDLSVSLRLEGYRCYFGGDSVVVDVVEGEGVGVYEEDELYYIVKVG